MQAATFCVAMLGVDGGTEFMQSARLKGKMKALERAAPERVPRSPFVV